MPPNQQPVVYDDSRSVLLFADLPSRRATIGNVVAVLGGRVIDACTLDEAVTRLDAQLSVDMVVVDAGQGSASDLGTLVGRLNDAAESGRYPSVVIMPPELIDLAMAAGGHSDVALLCGSDYFVETAAIAAGLAERETRLSDVSADSATPRLRQLSEEVGRIARVLATMSGEDQISALAPTRAEVSPVRRAGDAVVDAMQVRAMIRARRLRELYFSADLFADPAWDMLLDLMAARLERRQVAVSSLCIAAAVPPTTALRWIKLLTDQGILVRIADPTDGRRVFIELADSAADGMMSYLAAAQRLATITP